MNKEADQPKGPDSQEQELRKIGKQELQEILAQHERWVESEGKEGTRADLRGANLQVADLSGAKLTNAKLQGANLRGANLQKAFLTIADLQGANLQGADLFRAKLQEANLQGANLQGANFTWATGLTTSQVKSARSWDRAFYSDDLLTKLGLPFDHKQMLCIQLADLAPWWCPDLPDQR